MAGNKTYLCSLSELPQNVSKGFSTGSGNRRQDIFLVQREGEIFGYINRCPHTGVNLDWIPDQFLDVTGTLIQCATHGAQFRINHGLCVHGPCYGASLTPVSIVIQEDKVFIEDTPIT